MKPIIAVSSSELFLKNKNHHLLSMQFINNLRQRLDGIGIKPKIVKDNNTISIYDFDLEKKDLILNLIKKIPGVTFVRFGYMFQKFTSPEDIIKNISTLTHKKDKDFKIVVKSDTGKLDLEQKQAIISIFATFFIKEINWKVNLDLKEGNIIQYRITKKGSYLFFEKHKGYGGYFQGEKNTTVVSLLSGGVDSILATLMMAYRGCRIILLSFSVEKNKEFNKKINDIVLELKKFICIEDVYFFNIEEIGVELFHLKERNYRMIFLKRVFIHMANKLANDVNAKAIVTGESLNQVASQTLSSITCIDDAGQIPILRPLIGMHKETIKKNLTTYSEKLLQLSEINVSELCSDFHPREVITQPKIERIRKIEEKHYLLSNIIDLCYENNMKLIKELENKVE